MLATFTLSSVCVAWHPPCSVQAVSPSGSPHRELQAAGPVKNGEFRPQCHQCCRPDGPPPCCYGATMTMQTWSDVRSQSLGMATTITVFTPQSMSEATNNHAGRHGAPGHANRTQAKPGAIRDRKSQPTDVEIMRPTAGESSAQAGDTGTPGLLILLHGLTGNHAIWPMRTDLQTLCDIHNLVIALPDGQRSFWIDQAVGLKWGTWVGQELPRQLQNTLRVSRSRAETFIGGLSMGGYGAFRTAFDFPETFAGALSLSGTLDVAERAFRSRHLDLYETGFGNLQTPRPEDDLIARMTNQNTSDTMRDTRFFACCGTDDRLLKQNRHFRDVAGNTSLDLAYAEGPGSHDFRFWNDWLPVALDRLIR